MSRLYDTDYQAWTRRTAADLRAGRVDAVDLCEIAEEIDDLGKSERRALESCLAQLLLHLLKWDKQPELRSVSWQISIRKQRRQLERILSESPSLRPCLPEFIATAYLDALDDAIAETGFAPTAFPPNCPYTIEYIVSDALPLADARGSVTEP